MGAAPIYPGINDKFSIPYKFLSVLHSTTLSHSSPAPTSIIVCLLVSAFILIPLIWL